MGPPNQTLSTDGQCPMCCSLNGRCLPHWCVPSPMLLSQLEATLAAPLVRTAPSSQGGSDPSLSVSGSTSAEVQPLRGFAEPNRGAATRGAADRAEWDHSGSCLHPGLLVLLCGTTKCSQSRWSLWCEIKAGLRWYCLATMDEVLFHSPSACLAMVGACPSWCSVLQVR